MAEFQVYNSYVNQLSKLPSKEVLNLYVCGPTIYNDSHLGHARTYIMFDVMRRVIENHTGKLIKYGMNITDIDDKILDRIKYSHFKNLLNDDRNLTLGEMALELSKTHTEEEMTPSSEQYQTFIDQQFKNYFDDMSSLNVKTPDMVVRVSEKIPQIIEYIQNLIDLGYAYTDSNDNKSVYFDTQAYKGNFGTCTLHNHSDEKFVSAKSSAYAKYKKDKNDFVLWKAIKTYEFGFETPHWGKGRPGWHIECSTIINEIFGDDLDMHGGGIDLKYPHHHNEFLQSTASSSKPLTEFFIYIGHLHVNSEKMAQSLKNFTTIKQFIQKYSSRLLRLLFLKHSWSEPMEYSEEEVSSDISSLDAKIDMFMRNLRSYKNHKSNASQLIIKQKLKNFSDAAVQHLKNNFNTPQLLLELSEFITYINREYLSQEADISSDTVKLIYRKMKNLLQEDLGLEYKNNRTEETISNQQSLKVILEIRHKIRETAINTKDSELFRLTDWIRDVQIPRLGYTVQDGKASHKII